MRNGYLALMLLPLLAQAERRVFLDSRGPLTEATARPARAAADSFLRSALGGGKGLSPEDFAGTQVIKEYKTAHNGVTHLVYGQRFNGIDVYNASFVVNVDRDGRVINAGGTLYPRPSSFPQDSGVSRPAAPDAYLPPELVWFGVNGSLRPAWLLHERQSDTQENSARVVDYSTGDTLDSQPLTFHQNPSGLVFERSSPRPQPAPGAPILNPAWVARTVQSFRGDPTASPRGWVAGNTTAGNNAVVGVNALGISFWPTPLWASAPSLDFSFPLQLGEGAPPPFQFPEAAAVNLFYWINRSHDLFHAAGFDEASGNFQQDNFGKGGIGGDPIYAYSHFGYSGPGGAQLNNAFFSNRRGDDGAQAMVAMFLGTDGYGYTDGSYDAHVIVHEYTHGVSFRLVRRGYESHQGRAMGEAWSDFFGLEFLTPDGAPLDGVYTRAEYLYGTYGTGSRTRPYSTRMDVNPLTYADLGRVINAPQVHADGEIWVETLWEMRANLIRQFGESEGRRRTRLLVIDGMKLSLPAPSMLDMRDAILLADRVGFKGESQAQIWAAFAKRGMGVLAYSPSGDSVAVKPSFEEPSRKANIGFHRDSYDIGETARVMLQDNGLTGRVSLEVVASSGDSERIALERQGDVYIGFVPTSINYSAPGDQRLAVAVGDTITARYFDADTGSGGQQVERTVPVRMPYSVFTSNPAFTFEGEAPLGIRGGQGLSRRVDFGFQFPFFGSKFGSARVYSDGLISFDTTVPGTCRDTTEFSKVTAVAPMWAPIRTTGAGQDVWVARTADSISLRWVAETNEPQPKPVNFAATLYADGRIRYQYGSGNRGVTSGLSVSGCAGAGPVVGISKGNESFFLTSTVHHLRPDLENAPQFQYEPPEGAASKPAGRIDSPAPNGEAKGLLSVRATVWDSTHAPVLGFVMVDGRFVGRTSFAVPRPNACVTERLPNCQGLAADIDLSATGLGSVNIPPGPHGLQIRVANSRGGYTDFPEEPVPIVVGDGAAEAPTGAVDSPTAGEEVSGTVIGQGWAGSPSLRILLVDVLVDGVTVTSATYGVPRNEICQSVTPAPTGCPGVGFRFAWNTRSLAVPIADGPHGLQVRVLDQLGRFTTFPETPIPITVRNGPNQLPTGVLVTPAQGDTLSGIARIWGYGWDPDGRVTTALLLVDGEQRAVIPYGEPRPGECAVLENVRGCPNIGFALEFDTRTLTNGQHVLGVILVDDSGGSRRLESPNRNGINITVDNR